MVFSLGFKGRKTISRSGEIVDLNLLQKVRELGMLRTMQRGGKFVCHLWGKMAPWFVRYRFYKNLCRLVLGRHLRHKRVLGVWDLSALPWSIGDPMMFVESLSLVKIEQDATAVDICVLYDREAPGGTRRVNLDADQAEYHVLNMLPVFRTSPFLESLFMFADRAEFYDFLRRSADRYVLFPSVEKHLGFTYNFYGGAPIPIHRKFFDAHGYLPHLRIGGRETAWARSFLRAHCGRDRIAVILSLKQTEQAPERNADLCIWTAFVDHCAEHFPEVMFVQVGLKEESDEGLRRRENVVVAKDHGTTIVEDLALIRSGCVYMGTVSGINLIAIFSDMPYLLFQMPMYSMKSWGIPPGKGFWFAQENQKLFDTSFDVTTELLIKEFTHLYGSVDRGKWLAEIAQDCGPVQTHPAAKPVNRAAAS